MNETLESDDDHVKVFNSSVLTAEFYIIWYIQWWFHVFQVIDFLWGNPWSDVIIARDHYVKWAVA